MARNSSPTCCASKSRVTLGEEVFDGTGHRELAEGGLSIEPTQRWPASLSVTELAGRGVGMGAVRRTVTQLGGQLAERSQVGRGTTIELQIPVHTELYVPLRGGDTLLPDLHSKPPPKPALSAASG